jgi:predicted nuclease with TOPRIM domain
MAEVTNELIYSVLQTMQSDLAELKFDVRDLKVRMTLVEEHMGHSIIGVSGINARLDRLNDRVERIETRIGLVEDK